MTTPADIETLAAKVAALPVGDYRFAAEVANPTHDRRAKHGPNARATFSTNLPVRVARRPALHGWTQTTVSIGRHAYLRVFADPKGEHAHCTDAEHASRTRFPRFKQLLAAVAEARPESTLGHALADYGSFPLPPVLALLIEHGALTLGQVKAALGAVENLEEAAYDALLTRHGLKA